MRFEGAMEPREQLFWNLTLQHLLLGCPDDAAAGAIFDRLATNAVGGCTCPSEKLCSCRTMRRVSIFGVLPCVSVVCMRTECLLHGL